jgi:hypothetical protein
VQCRTVTDRDFVFKHRWILASACVNYTIILNIAAVADANVVHVAPQNGVAPNRRLLTDVDVANYLGALVDIRAFVNMRVIVAKWSDHFRAIVAQTIDSLLTRMRDCQTMSNENLISKQVFSAVLIGIALLAASCAGSLFKVKPAIELPPLPENAHTASAGGVTVRVAPLLSDEETQDLFEANLPLSGVLPIRLELAFESGVQVETKRARFRLRDGAGREWKLISAKSAIGRILKANEIFAYNPNSRKQFEKEFAAYAIDLKTPLSSSNPRTQGFLFFETPNKLPVESSNDLILQIERLPQPLEIKLD